MRAGNAPVILDRPPDPDMTQVMVNLMRSRLVRPDIGLQILHGLVLLLFRSDRSARLRHRRRTDRQAEHDYQ